jgi:electron transport complex protein RnfC
VSRDFPGGLHLADAKHLSNQAPITPAPLPPELVFPLQQHIGEPAEPVVAVGDRVLKGQMLAAASGYVSVPVHASTSGVVVAIEHRPVPHPSGLSGPCVVLAPDGEDRWVEHGPVADYQTLDRSALRNRIRDAGIVGLGGGGFPTFIKLNPGPGRRVDTVILNGAECEPYITCDDLLMRERAADIVDGIRVMLHILGAERCLVGIEDNKPEAIAALREAAQQATVQADGAAQCLGHLA